MATTNPQSQYLDNQDIFDIDIDDMYKTLIVPIDAQRSHFNAIVPNALNTITANYQESRCHAFLRMTGFPIVAASGAFYSPGFDPNLNMNIAAQKTNSQTAAAVIANDAFIQSQSARELVPNTYKQMFSFGGVQSSAVCIGSIFLRSFAQQFTPDLQPLSYDKAQIQTVASRNDWIDLTYGASTATFPALIPDISSVASLLQSTHILKPFVVDPRIDGYIRPAVNQICAPFLLNKTQTFVFQSQNATSSGLKRPYIERVISTRFSSTNVAATNQQQIVNAIINQIYDGDYVLDTDLISIASNPSYKLYQSEYDAFNKYIKIIRALVQELHDSIVGVQEILHHINFQPQPNTTNGIEVGSNGGNVNVPTPGDPNNRQIENNIIKLTQSQILDQLSYDTGAGSESDVGNYAFDNISDTVSDAKSSTQKSWDAQLSKLNGQRNKNGNNALDDLKTIEIIMGEFSGIGLLDIFAIQAALWIMDPLALLGLIDTNAFNRLNSSNFPDISIRGLSPIPVLDALTNFEQTLQAIYQLIDSFIETLDHNGHFTDTDPVNTTNTSTTSS